MAKVHEIAPLSNTKAPRKRLNDQDILAMAELNAKRLNDVEACEQLDINYETWRSWKTRAKNQPRYARILSRIKGAKIKNCMEAIDKAGVRDWRATREYLSLIDSERFNDRQQPSVSIAQTNVYQQLGIDVERLLAEGASKARSKVVVDVQAVKLLGEHSKE